MKSFIATICACLFLVSVNAMNEELRQQWMARLNGYAETCIAESKATQEDYKSWLAHNIPTSHEAKCMILCIHRQYNVQHEDGSFNYEGTFNALKDIEPIDSEIHKKILTAVNICDKKDISHDNPCESGYLITSCIVTEGKKIGLSTELFE